MNMLFELQHYSQRCCYKKSYRKKEGGCVFVCMCVNVCACACVCVRARAAQRRAKN